MCTINRASEDVKINCHWKAEVVLSFNVAGVEYIIKVVELDS